MRADKLVAYYRVSIARQEASGLGLDAQRQAVAAFLGGSAVVAEFTETESGKRSDRPELARAIGACRLYGARLVIAKLDRLSRDAHFLLGLEKAGVDFVAADMPHANRLTVGIMALVAEEERRMISARTRRALAAAKVRGTVLGGYRGHTVTMAVGEAGRRSQAVRVADLVPVPDELRAAGTTSLGEIAAALNACGIPAARGGAWTATPDTAGSGSSTIQRLTRIRLWNLTPRAREGQGGLERDRAMADPAKIVRLDRVRAGREALRGAFPIGPTRSRLLAALECGHDCVLFSADQLTEEFETDRPIQHLLQALGGGWSAWRSDRHPGIWIFQRHIPAEKAWARITGQSAE